MCKCLCLCERVYAHERSALGGHSDDDEGIRSPGAGVIAAVRCHVGAWNGAQVLWKNNMCS